MAVVLPPPARGAGTLILSAQRFVWAEKAMAPHSSTLAWKIPWMEEPGSKNGMGPSFNAILPAKPQPLPAAPPTKSLWFLFSVHQASFSSWILPTSLLSLIHLPSHGYPLALPKLEDSASESLPPPPPPKPKTRGDGWEELPHAHTPPRQVHPV